jgi:nucleolar protein TMA23
MPGLNASAHLQSLGWAGPGHPLNPNAYKQKGSRGLAYDPSASKTTNASHFAAGGNGLIRPLLVSKKEGNLGLGRRAHEPQKGNEWWLKGFEAALKKDGSTAGNSSAAGSGTSTPRMKQEEAGEELQRRVNVQAGRFGGLYGFFVRGETVGGTIGEEDGEAERRGKKRKSEVLAAGEEVEEYESSSLDDGVRKRRKKKKKKKKKKKRRNSVNGDDAEQDFGQIAAFMTVRDKSSRREASERRKLRESEQFRVAGEWLSLKEGRRNEDTGSGVSRTLAEEGSEDGTAAVREPKRGKDGKKRRRIITDANGLTREETKEERRMRRAARRERKDLAAGRDGRGKSVVARRIADTGTATPTTTATTTSASASGEEDEGDDKAAKKRRKEERRERRRRKEDGR